MKSEKTKSIVSTYPKEEEEDKEGGSVHDQALFESESRGHGAPIWGLYLYGLKAWLRPKYM